MSAAENIWKSFESFFQLQGVFRSGFTRTGVYGFYVDPNDPKDNPEILRNLEKYNVSTTGCHCGRTANLLYDIMRWYPMYFRNEDISLAIKVALCHDIGESIVGDIAADGSAEHEKKKAAEWAAVQEFYSYQPKGDRSAIIELHRQFDEDTTFLGQAIRVADKLDALGELIILEGCGFKGDVLKKRIPSEQDMEYAEKIGSSNCTDEWAYCFYQMMEQQDYDKRLKTIAAEFLTAGLKSIGRPLYEWWLV